MGRWAPGGLSHLPWDEPSRAAPEWDGHGTARHGWARGGHGRAGGWTGPRPRAARPPFTQSQLLLALACSWPRSRLPGVSLLPAPLAPSPHPPAFPFPWARLAAGVEIPAGRSGAEWSGGGGREGRPAAAGPGRLRLARTSPSLSELELGAQGGHWAVAAWQEGAHDSLSRSHPPTHPLACPEPGGTSASAWHGRWWIHSTASHNVFLLLGLVEVKGRAGHLLGGPSAFRGLVSTPLHPPTNLCKAGHSALPAEGRIKTPLPSPRSP